MEGLLDWFSHFLRNLWANVYFQIAFWGMLSYLTIRKIVGYVTTRTPVAAHTVTIFFGSIALAAPKYTRYITMITMSRREEIIRRILNAKAGSVVPTKLVTDGPFSENYGVIMSAGTVLPIDIDGKTEITSGKNSAKALSVPMEIWMAELVKRLVRLTTTSKKLICIYALGGGTATAACKTDVATNVKGALRHVQAMLPIVITPVHLSGQRLENLTYLAENIFESTIGKSRLFLYVEQDSQALNDEKLVDEHISNFAACISARKHVLRDDLGNVIQNLGNKYHVCTLAVLEGFSLSSMELTDLRRELCSLSGSVVSVKKRVHLRRLFEEGIRFNFDEKDLSIILNIPTDDLKHFDKENVQLLELIASTVETELKAKVVTRTAVPTRRGAEPRLFILVPLTEEEWTSTELGRLCPLLPKPLEELLALQGKLISPTPSLESQQIMETASTKRGES